MTAKSTFPPTNANSDRHWQRTALLAALREPERLVECSLADWDWLLRMAHLVGLASRLAIDVIERGLLEAAPPQVQPHLRAAQVRGERDACVTRWEVDRLEEALRTVDAPVILLKGAAYTMAGLGVGRGRLSSDLDLLVPLSTLPEVERVLLQKGWSIGDLDARDQRYFRQWLHELPPLVHRRRRTVLDVHHAILPRTDRLQVDSALLIADSQPLPGTRFRALSPADMLLHSAAHLFRNGAFGHGLRDLADLDGLLRVYGAEPEYWPRLLARARQLNLRWPCYCGVRYAQRYFETPVPAETQAELARWRFFPGAVAAMDRLVDRSLLPRSIDQPDRLRGLAISLLSYWPLPRAKTMLTALFWTKRLHKRGEGHSAAREIEPAQLIERGAG